MEKAFIYYRNELILYSGVNLFAEITGLNFKM
jgi:hypothetical protein